MYLRAALSVLPRPRPKVLPSTVVTFSSTAAVADVAAYNSVCGYTLSDFLPPLYPHGLSSSDFRLALTRFLGTARGLSAATITRLTRD